MHTKAKGTDRPNTEATRTETAGRFVYRVSSARKDLEAYVMESKDTKSLPPPRRSSKLSSISLDGAISGRNVGNEQSQVRLSYHAFNRYLFPMQDAEASQTGVPFNGHAQPDSYREGSGRGRPFYGHYDVYCEWDQNDGQVN
jgi:hypothetical protein